MKKITLAMILMVAGVCYAQQPVFNPANNTLTWTISVDTTQSMTGCIGNNYNAEGQCEGGMETVYHTGNVALSVTNRRTGQTVTANQTKQGGVATASITIPALPGDVFSYTETNQVFCPIINQWTGTDGVPGWFEIATVQSSVVALKSTGLILDTWITASACTTSRPDWNPTQVSDFPNPAPWGWLMNTICFSYNAHQPWACSTPIGQYKFTTAQLAYPGCTSNP